MDNPVYYLRIIFYFQVENVKLLDRFSARNTAVGTLYLTTTHLIFVDGAGKKEIWVSAHARDWLLKHRNRKSIICYQYRPGIVLQRLKEGKLILTAALSIFYSGNCITETKGRETCIDHSLIYILQRELYYRDQRKGNLYWQQPYLCSTEGIVLHI